MTEVEKKGIGKSKIGLLISGVLIVILAISSLWLFTEVNSLQSQVSTLETDNSSLQSQVSSLSTDKNNLESQVSSLETWLDGNKTLLQTTINERNQLETWLDGNVTAYESQIATLNSQIDSLNDQINNLQSQVNSLTTENNNLQIQKDTLQNQLNLLNVTYQNYMSTHSHNDSEYDSLQSEYDNYVATHHYTDKEYNEARSSFSFYYVKPEQKFGVYDLEDELYGLEWIEPYQESVFDCSEMSAYLEWYLENEGWHTYIVCGETPWDGGYHAWLLVETSTDHYMPVESTTIEIVWWDNPYFDNYFIYDYRFETIQEAVDYNESEFDWWKSP